MGIKEYFSNKYGKKQNQDQLVNEVGVETVVDTNMEAKGAQKKQKEPTQAQLQRAIAYLASMWKGTKEQFVEFVEEHKSTIKRFAVGTIGLVMLLFLTGCRAGVEFEAWLDLDGERPGIHEKGEMPSQEIGKPGNDGNFYFGGDEDSYVGPWVDGSTDTSTNTGRNPSDTYGDYTYTDDTYVGEWVGDAEINGGSLIIGSTVDVENNTQYIIVENNVIVEGNGNTIIITNGGDTNVITPENNMTIVIRDQSGKIIGVYENGVYTPVTENVGENPGENGGNGGNGGNDTPGTDTPGTDTPAPETPPVQNQIPSNLCYVDLLATYFRGREAHVESITVAEDPNNEVDAVDMNFRGQQGKWVTWICKMTDGTTMNLTISLENNHLVNGGNTTGLVSSAGVHADGDGTNFEAAAKAALASWGVSPEYIIQSLLGGDGMGMGH